MIKYIQGDIFDSGADIICHQVNCQGRMGSGLAKQVRAKFPNVYAAYAAECARLDSTELLGGAQIIKANDTTYIANLFGQDRYGYDGGVYTNYKALESALFQIAVWATLNEKKTIAIPYKIGCGLGGADWERVEQMILRLFKDFHGDVYICEYAGG